jgi:hypothetical protein
LFIARSWSLARYTVLMFLVLIVVALLFPVQARSRNAALRAQCSNRLKQIDLALHVYEERYHSFPPAYIADRTGKPMHSWRVLILPFLGEKDVYDRYDFNEPWDGPNNRKLLDARPSVYACPGDETAYARNAACTSYVAVVGENAAWQSDKPRRLTDPDLRDHASSTIMLTETADAGINWTEPKDISLDALQSTDSSSGAVTVSSKHGCYYHDSFYDYECDTPYVANVGLLDGSVGFLSLPVSTERLRNVLQIGGATKENLDYSVPYRASQFKATLRWRSCAALAACIVSVTLLLYHAYRRRKAMPQPPEEIGERRG